MGDPLKTALRDVLIEFKLCTEQRDRDPHRKGWPEHTDIYEHAIDTILAITQDERAAREYLRRRLGA